MLYKIHNRIIVGFRLVKHVMQISCYENITNVNTCNQSVNVVN